MFIENLIRIGMPYVNGEISPKEVIEQITDVKNSMTRNFWRNVWIVEYDNETQRSSIFHCQWGDPDPNSKKKETFLPDYGKVFAAPINLPSGGDPTKPQGAYGVGVYLLYDKHFQGFTASATFVEDFLLRRLERTINCSLNSDQISEISMIIHQSFRSVYRMETVDKNLGILVLAVMDKESSPFYYTDCPIDHENALSFSESKIHSNKYLTIDLIKVVESIWQAKEQEGMEKGYKEKGVCYFTGKEGKVISLYNKTWPWFTTTWEGPFSIYQNETQIVESIALSPEAYRALTYGASVVKKMTKPIPAWLSREIFSPVGSAKGKEKSKSAPEIFAFVFALPLTDSFLESQQESTDYLQAMARLLNKTEPSPLNLHLDRITGIDAVLPYGFQKELYRLTLVYYTGDSSRGDIHLRKVIEDVIPSTITGIKGILESLDTYLEEVAIGLDINLDKIQSSYQSLPYLLIKAYGGNYLWATLSKLLHRQPIDYQTFIRNIAIRISELAKDLSSNFYLIKLEVFFYLIFSEFYKKYNLFIEREGGNHVIDWRLLQDKIESDSLEEIKPKNLLEIGYYAGHLVRQFSKQYYMVQGEKDFMRDRVMTYGASLTPDMIYKNALVKFSDYAKRLNIKLNEEFAAKVGIVNLAYLTHKEEIQQNKDDFLAAFWAGYSLNISKSKKQDLNGEGEIND